MLPFAKRGDTPLRLTIDMKRKTILQAVTLIVIGVVVALAANAFASRDRRLALAGSYPNALKVPSRETVPVAAIAPTPVAPVSTAPATVTTATTTTTTTAATTTQPAATVAIETVGLNPAAKTPKAPTTTTAPTPNSPPPTPPSEDRFLPHPDKPYIEIAFTDVKALHAKNVLFLDARRTSVYEQGHIAGARTYSVWESDIEDKIRKLFDERGDPSAQALPIVIYCSGGDCEDSHMLAQKLWGIQFNNLYVYKDGFPDWQQRGGAVHTGANP
jgi:rhodanese-related sulfurtransferase